jgi:outer membrane protein assembly factor BamB
MKAPALFLLAIAWAQDWPQWRGPDRDGVSAASAGAWPEKLNLKWKVEVGEGHSSPVVAGGRIYVHARRGEREVVSCLDLADGRIIWQQNYEAPYTVNPAARAHGKGVKSTPVVDGRRICTFGIDGILSCFDAQTGKLHWRKEFGSPDFGTAMSPLLDRGLLIAHTGTRSGGALIAFDAGSGQEKWRWAGDGPGYASPIVIELGGTRQVVTQTRSNIVGVSADMGRLLWRIPFTTPYEQNIVTPVLYRDRLIFSGLQQGVMGVKVSNRGGDWTAERLWENKNVSMYMSSPVVSGDLLFGFSHRNSGQFFCLDPRSGETLWTSPGRQAENAAIVTAGPVLLMLTDGAELIVANKTGKAFETIRKYTVADTPTWAHPVVLDQGVLVKDAASLAMWTRETP